MILKNVLWDFLGKVLGQSSGFIVSLILARLLTPHDFGVVGIVMVVVGVSQAFLDMGLGAALIQRKEVSQKLYSSVFWINVSIGILATCSLFLLSSWAADFYEQEALIPILRTMSITLFLGGLTSIHRIRLVKSMAFKKQSMVSLASSVMSGILGVSLAYLDFGVWALVAQIISNQLFSTLILWGSERWFPSMIFSWEELKQVLGFSSLKFVDGVLSNFYQRLDLLILGKLFPFEILGFYTRSKGLDNYVRQYSSGSLVNVYFPAISKVQDKPDELRKLYKKSIMAVSFLSIGLSGMLFLVSKDLILFLYGQKWLYSAYLFKFMAITGFVWPLSAIMVNLVVGMGHAGKHLVLGLYKKTVGLTALAIGFSFGIEGFLYATICSNIIALALNITYVSKLLKVGFAEHFSWTWKCFFVALLAVVGISFYEQDNVLLSLIIKGLLFSSFYLATLLLIDGELGKLIRSKTEEVYRILVATPLEKLRN